MSFGNVSIQQLQIVGPYEPSTQVSKVVAFAELVGPEEGHRDRSDRSDRSSSIVQLGKLKDGAVKLNDILAFAGLPTLGYVDGLRYTVNMNVPIGPAILQLHGNIDLGSSGADIIAYIKVPLVPWAIQAGGLKGNLKDGITTKVDIVGLVSGSITLIVRDKHWLCVGFTIKIFTIGYSGEFRMIRLPVPD
uniref:Uncharacterized protein n=1 Tax=Moniliophthora roreri TaxID=221103 RepID=A0A0W0FX51_MONRR